MKKGHGTLSAAWEFLLGRSLQDRKSSPAAAEPAETRKKPLPQQCQKVPHGQEM
jgi:hypothetical protein